MLPKCLPLSPIAHIGVAKDAMVSTSWSKSPLPSGWQWSSHWDLSALRHMQRLSKTYVGTVSFKGTDFQVLTLPVYFPDTALLVNLAGRDWQALPLASLPH